MRVQIAKTSQRSRARSCRAEFAGVGTHMPEGYTELRVVLDDGRVLHMMFEPADYKDPLFVSFMERIRNEQIKAREKLSKETP